MVTIEQIRRAIDLAQAATAARYTANACGTSWDRKKAEAAEDKAAEALDELERRLQ